MLWECTRAQLLMLWRKKRVVFWVWPWGQESHSLHFSMRNSSFFPNTQSSTCLLLPSFLPSFRFSCRRLLATQKTLRIFELLLQVEISKCSVVIHWSREMRWRLLMGLKWKSQDSWMIEGMDVFPTSLLPVVAQTSAKLQLSCHHEEHGRKAVVTKTQVCCLIKSCLSQWMCVAGNKASIMAPDGWTSPAERTRSSWFCF